jgi:hypothetical protein
MKLSFLLFIFPLMAFAATKKPSPAKETAKATVQMLRQVQDALNMVSEAASQCYDVKVAPSGRSYLLSDSLVKNLACSQLNPATVFRALQPNAFSTEKQWPVYNWPSNGIANCWSLALNQRQAFYLTHFGARATDSNAVAKYLGIAGGSMPEDVISIKDKTLSDTVGRAVTLNPAFRSQIEAVQSKHFYSLGNVGYIMGTRERGESDNRETLATLLDNAKKGRITAIILRASFAAQHVVLVKDAKKTGPDSYVFNVYDSNQPQNYYGQPSVQFNAGQFYAPNVVGKFHQDGYSAVGVFVTGEEDMDRIQTVVFNHYAQLCKKVKALEKEF